jgi:hypothetical protein
VSGAWNSNECPAGSERIETEAACRTAAAAAGKTAGAPFGGTYPGYPRGCYLYYYNGYAYFNAHVVGAGEASSRLLCAAVTGPTGAPPPRRCARACTGACSDACVCVTQPRARSCVQRVRCGGAAAHSHTLTYTRLGYLTERGT